jgi:hypothetical protein
MASGVSPGYRERVREREGVGEKRLRMERDK